METNTVYNKQNKSTPDIDVVHKDLTDARESTVSKVDEAFDAGNVKLSVDEKYHPEIRKMLRKHKDHWSGQLGNVNISQNRIYPIHGALSFNSAPYLAGPKTLELEQFEIHKQLKSGFIEHSVSERGCSRPFTRKKYGLLRF